MLPEPKSTFHHVGRLLGLTTPVSLNQVLVVSSAARHAAALPPKNDSAMSSLVAEIVTPLVVAAVIFGMRSVAGVAKAPPDDVFDQPVSDRVNVVLTAGRDSNASACASSPSHTRMRRGVISGSATSSTEATNSTNSAPLSL